MTLQLSRPRFDIPKPPPFTRRQRKTSAQKNGFWNQYSHLVILPDRGVFNVSETHAHGKIRIRHLHEIQKLLTFRFLISDAIFNYWGRA